MAIRSRKNTAQEAGKRVKRDVQAAVPRRKFYYTHINVTEQATSFPVL
jgi:hypothetical protein